MSLLEIPGGATIDQNNKKNPKTIEMKKKIYIYIYIYIYLTNPQNDHNRDQNFGNCSKILKVVKKKKKTLKCHFGGFNFYFIFLIMI